ncbi:probable serine carboxypeptidase CPVL [Oppia nitens]|uniref:probable serine carboxypeptidase CPVL n=1 Tax=Oppia nitens TaxID=1686743 RepID=UPI0023DC90D3|nr:probable serine carboxypeptidase CPVL [Oppia nitens]
MAFIKSFISLLLIIILIIDKSNAIFRKNLFPSHSAANINSRDPGQPLFLTPMIESGHIEEAQQASRVTGLSDAPDIISYSGFLTVNKKFNSNMFFWYFPALNKDKKAPLLLWLQGGPGGSSLFGLFNENGPLVLDKNLKSSIRQYTWAQEYSMIFIDNPVGTGFSFTHNDLGYATNETDVARDLYTALQQFFTLFPNERQNDFYITGESYAGKYVPAIAYKIHTEGNASNINLKGIAIGDGLCDPATQSAYGDFLYQIALLDENQRDFFNAEENKAVDYINKEQYFEAFKIFDLLLNGDLINSTSYFTNSTGLTFYYNFLMGSAPEEFGYYPKYLGLESTRRAIHVGNLPFSEGNIVEQHLLNDIMKSVKPWISTLLDNYKVLIYSGQLDIIVAAPLTENFVRSIQWSKADQYKKAERIIWKVDKTDKEVAGYVRQVDRFLQIVVRNGGHILPFDQPRASYDMINRFVKNKSFQ